MSDFADAHGAGLGWHGFTPGQSDGETDWDHGVDSAAADPAGQMLLLLLMMIMPMMMNADADLQRSCFLYFIAKKKAANLCWGFVTGTDS